MNVNTQPEVPTQNLWQRIPVWVRGFGILIVGIVIGVALAAPDREKLKQAEKITASEQAIYAQARDDRDTAKAEQDELEKQSAELKDEIDEARSEQNADERDAKKRLKSLKRKINGAKRTLAKRSFAGDGTYIVGQDIEPGTYRAAASPGCYWARLSSGEGGGIDNIIDNNNTDGPAVITVGSGDFAVEVARCGTFRK